MNYCCPYSATQLNIAALNLICYSLNYCCPYFTKQLTVAATTLICYFTKYYCPYLATQLSIAAPIKLNSLLLKIAKRRFSNDLFELN